jgi:ABC-type oligopeptide transport system ATPase subunit
MNMHLSFQNWESEGGVLWIRGKPGSGKSTLAKQILTEIRKTNTNVVTGAWFYSMKLEAFHRSHVSMLRNLLYSFMQQKKSLFREHIEHYRTARTSREPWEWTRQDLEALLYAICAASSTPDLIAVIDALDEAEDVDEKEESWNHVTNLFLGLSELQGSRIRFIVLSRPYRSLQNAFRFCEQIHLEQETELDVVKVIDEGLVWLRRTIENDHITEVHHESSHPGVLRRKRRQMQARAVSDQKTSRSRAANSTLLDAEVDAMREFLITHAKGVFLWVTLVLRELRQISKVPLFDVRNLKSCLLALPSELEGLYATITNRLEARGLGRTRQILAWTVGTSQTRPLTLSMLYDALGIEEDADVDLLLQSPTDPFWLSKPIFRSWASFSLDVYEQCGGMVDIIPPSEVKKPFQDYLDEDIDDQWIVTLLHRTALDFLATTACPIPLRIDTAIAQNIVEKGLMVFLQVYLPISGQGPSFNPHLFEKRSGELWQGDTSDTLNIFDLMIQKPEDSVFEYLEDRRLLGFALQYLPQMWLRPDYSHLAGYETLLCGHTNYQGTWTAWLHNLSGGLLVDACEQAFYSALKTLNTLLSFNADTKRNATAVIYATIMLFCSKYGPAKHVPVAVTEFVKALSHQYTLWRPYSYEMVIACTRSDYRNLADYITWYWVEKLGSESLGEYAWYAQSVHKVQRQSSLELTYLCPSDEYSNRFDLREHQLETLSGDESEPESGPERFLQSNGPRPFTLGTPTPRPPGSFRCLNLLASMIKSPTRVRQARDSPALHTGNT